MTDQDYTRQVSVSVSSLKGTLWYEFKRHKHSETNAIFYTADAFGNETHYLIFQQGKGKTKEWVVADYRTSELIRSCETLSDAKYFVEMRDLIEEEEAIYFALDAFTDQYIDLRECDVAELEAWREVAEREGKQTLLAVIDSLSNDTVHVIYVLKNDVEQSQKQNRNWWEPAEKQLQERLNFHYDNRDREYYDRKYGGHQYVIVCTDNVRRYQIKSGKAKLIVEDSRSQSRSR